MPFVLSFWVSTIRLRWADQPENLRADVTAGSAGQLARPKACSKNPAVTGSTVSLRRM